MIRGIFDRPYRQGDARLAADELVGVNDEIPGIHHDRFQLALQLAFRASADGPVITEWGNRLPQPDVSAEILERVMHLSEPMGRLSLRITVDGMMGCWSLPLKEEYRADGVSRYPTVTDRTLDLHGVVAHRYVWKALINPGIESGVYLDHLCRAHACCNPLHLEPTTSSVNTRRGNMARRILSGEAELPIINV